jgi:hypothetical protein
MEKVDNVFKQFFINMKFPQFLIILNHIEKATFQQTKVLGFITKMSLIHHTSHAVQLFPALFKHW